MNHNHFGIDHTEIHAAENAHRAHLGERANHGDWRAKRELERLDRSRTAGFFTGVGAIALGSLAVSGGIIASSAVAPIAIVAGVTARIIAYCKD